MAQTPPSLLQHLREHPQDGDAWRRFDDLYRPLLQTWLRRYAVRPQYADDLAQQVFAVVLREMPTFRYDAVKGKFRSWLRRILANKLRDFMRSERAQPIATGDSDFYGNILNQLEDPNSDLSRLWDREHDEYVARRLLDQIQQDFAPITWKAFRRLHEGEKAAQIAADLNISLNAVYLAKSSVMKRLRQEIEGFSD